MAVCVTSIFAGCCGKLGDMATINNVNLSTTTVGRRSQIKAARESRFAAFVRTIEPSWWPYLNDEAVVCIGGCGCVADFVGLCDSLLRAL